MKNIYSQEETNFIINNYALLGKKECAKILNKTPRQIKSKIDILRRKNINLKLNKDTKEAIDKNKVFKEKGAHDYKVNPTQFMNITTPEAAYILGIIWADGYIHKKGYINSVRLTILKRDFQDIYSVFKKTGSWSIGYYQQKERQEQAHCTTNNRLLADFLIEHDYKAKSWESADKILNKIPENLKHFWFRGLLDGDGYVGKTKKCPKFTITSGYSQNWNFMEEICKDICIKYSIGRYVHKKSNNKHSVFVLCGGNAMKLLNYIYSDYESNNIGLRRKYKKYLEFKAP